MLMPNVSTFPAIQFRPKYLWLIMIVPTWSLATSIYKIQQSTSSESSPQEKSGTRPHTLTEPVI